LSVTKEYKINDDFDMFIRFIKGWKGAREKLVEFFRRSTTFFVCELVFLSEKMQVKCAKCLRDEKVSNTGLTAGWILDILEKHDEKFREAVGDGKVTKVKKHRVLLN
jgi:hypothetical protein